VGRLFFRPTLVKVGLQVLVILVAAGAFACGNQESTLTPEATNLSDGRQVYELLAGPSEPLTVIFEWASGDIPDGGVGQFAWRQVGGVRRLDAIWGPDGRRTGVFSIQRSFFDGLPPTESNENWACVWQEVASGLVNVSCSNTRAASPVIFSRVLDLIDASIVSEEPHESFAGRTGECYHVTSIGPDGIVCIDSTSMAVLFAGWFGDMGRTPGEAIRAVEIGGNPGPLEPALLQDPVKTPREVERSELLLPE
jgi:hypothetical protein